MRRRAPTLVRTQRAWLLSWPRAPPGEVGFPGEVPGTEVTRYNVAAGDFAQGSSGSVSTQDLGYRSFQRRRDTCGSANRSTTRENTSPGRGGARPDQVRDLAGSLPCEVFSRLSPATRRSQVRCRRMSPVADGWSLSTAVSCSRAAGRVLRGAPVSAVTRAERGKNGLGT